MTRRLVLIVATFTGFAVGSFSMAALITGTEHRCAARKHGVR